MFCAQNIVPQSHVNTIVYRRRAYSVSLLVLMTILTQTFFTFVRGHLVSLMLLSVWHKYKNLVVYYLLYGLFEFR